MDWITLAGLTVAVMGAASTGAMFGPGAWYDTLQKPVWTPPNWLFPLAWTILYAVMIYAAYRVAQGPIELAAPALAFWAAQIVLNALWSPVFFGLRKLGAALFVLGLLWGAVLATIILFWRVDWLSGALMVPYLFWGSYAGALNARIWLDNRGKAAAA